MIQTKQIIADNKATFSDFEDYYRIIEVIEEKLEHSPDMTIESCKALVEGISKTIMNKLEPETPHKSDAHHIVKQSLNAIEKYIFLEKEFVRSASSMIMEIAKIRNLKSDISHGREVPKANKSDINLAKMIMKITDEMVYYILNIYFNITLEFEEEEIKEDEEIYPYDKQEHESYNQMLDEQSKLSDISYSKALYEQDFDAYIYGLEEYIETMEE